MRFMSFLTPVPVMDAERLRTYLASHKEGSFTLLDVRQPGEYEKRRLPGGMLIPLAQLPSRLGELDPDKPVIVY